MARKGRTRRAKARKAGYRSGFEEDVATAAEGEGIEFKYESVVLKYVRPAKYKPDFKLKNGILVETKGQFKSSDRTKHLRVRESNPKRDIRFVFMRNNPINKDSTTTYTDWCDEHGFKWALKRIPKGWADE